MRSKSLFTRLVTFVLFFSRSAGFFLLWNPLETLSRWLQSWVSPLEPQKIPCKLSHLFGLISSPRNAIQELVLFTFFVALSTHTCLSSNKKKSLLKFKFACHVLTVMNQWENTSNLTKAIRGSLSTHTGTVWRKWLVTLPKRSRTEVPDMPEFPWLARG
jgi:hypothetical protein